MNRAALAAITVVLLVAAPGCRGSDASENSSSKASAANFVAVDPASASPTDQAIGRAQQRIRTNDDDDRARVDLANAYLQKARETADPSLYGKAEGLLDQAEKSLKKDAGFWVASGSLQLAQHRFEDALNSGKKAVAIDSHNETAFGVLVDANNELGKSADALSATQSMLDIRPGLAALSRASYARELRGDLAGAVGAMTQAVTAGGSGGGENVAYIQTLLGGLLLTNGDVAGAEEAYEQALIAFPNFAAAQAGQAQVLVARDKPSEAADLLRSILQRQPIETYAVAHGDALVAAGRVEEANDAYALVDTINRLFVANGVNVDREAALFAADHHPGKDAVKQARKALKERGSLASRDVLAWALFTSGDSAAAEKESDKALADGSKDPLQRFHAAVIAKQLGKTDKAAENLRIVLSTNPRFSGAHVAQVKDLAAQLGLPFPDASGVNSP